MQRVSGRLKKIYRIFLFCCIYPAAVIYRRFHPHIWLFFSRADETDGNAKTLFDWIGKKEECFFILDKKAKGYKKGMVALKSLKHLLYSAVAEAFVFDVSATCDLVGHRLRKLTGARAVYIFLQHGTIQTDIPLYHYSETKYDLVMTTSQGEFDFLQKTFGYPPNHVVLTGQARHDDLIENASDKKYILVMPTWRMELKDADSETFTESEYFKKLQSLLQNRDLLDLLRSTNTKICFYLHYMIRNRMPLFSLPPDELMYRETDSVHELIRDCSALITDYSSVAFDAALAEKPIVYYQFQKYHYDEENSYFGFERDGFGPVVTTEEELMNELKKFWSGENFTQLPQYRQRRDAFFDFKDTDNCKRIYAAIKQCVEKK